MAGTYPYTNVFRFSDGREHGRIVSTREGGRDTDHFFLVDATTDQGKVRSLWQQGQSVASIETTLGIKLWVPGGISDLAGNIATHNFGYTAAD